MAGNGHKRVTKSDLQTALIEGSNQTAFLVERLAELELALEDQGWQRYRLRGDIEFSRSGLRRIIDLCRTTYVKNPLIRRAVQVQRHYVFGQGVTVAARDDDVNNVIQSFWNDPKNEVELTTQDALGDREVELHHDGNLFFAFFTRPDDGSVQVRSFPVDEVDEIIVNPEDWKDAWFYLRRWSVKDLATGGTTERKVLYPAIDHTREMHVGATPHPEASHPMGAIDGVDIDWDSPVLHVKTGGLSRMRFGVPDVYAAVDWAIAVKEDLENYATIKKAHARFAWRLAMKGGQGKLDAARASMETTMGLDRRETNPTPQTGAAFIGTDPNMLEPIRTAGAQANPEEGRRMWLMVSAATGIPETILAGNADVGNLATARSLDRPTEMQMRDRQILWRGVLKRVFAYVIEQAVAKGKVSGKVINEARGWKRIALAEVHGKDDEQTVDIDFPSVIEHDPDATIDSITKVAPLNYVPERALAKLTMNTLGMADVDELLDEIFDADTGERKEPIQPAGPQVPDFGGLFSPEDQEPGDAQEHPLARREAAVRRAVSMLREALTARA